MQEEESLELAADVASRVEQGRLTREGALGLLHARLQANCPGCQQTFDEALVLLYGPRPNGTRRRANVLAAAEAALAAERTANPPKHRYREPSDTGERLERAHKALAELRKVPGWKRRHNKVVLEWYRFRGVEVARQMLVEAREALPGFPEDSERWADLANVALGGDHESLYTDRDAVELLRLRCRLFQANAARCRGEFSEAYQELETASFAARELDIRELAFWAEAKSFSASLYRDNRDFPAATREARASASLYRSAGNCAREVAETTWQLAAIRGSAGDFDAALAKAREAALETSRLPFARLALDLRHAEAFYLARLGRFAEAASAQHSLRNLYERHPDKELLRQWVRGIVAAGLGESQEAEDCFRFARDGFVQKKAAYDAALVTLDWTIHLLDSGRPAEVVPLAVSMGRTFEALGVARETLGSWSLLTEAAERLELDRAEAAAWVEVLDFERVVGRGR
jgi:hypothetical protein